MAADPLGALAPVVAIGIVLTLFRRKAGPMPWTGSRKKPRRVAPAGVPATSTKLEAAVAGAEAEAPSREGAVRLFHLSQQRGQEGRLIEAEALAAQVSEQIADLSEVGTHETLAVWSHHVVLLHALGRMADAERIQRRIVEMSDRVDARVSPAGAQHRIRLAAILDARGDAQGADACLRAATEIVEALRESDAPAQRPALAGVLHELAECRIQRGSHADAERALRSKLALDRILAGEEGAALVPTLESLSRVLQVQAQREEARVHLERALYLAERAWGATHPRVAQIARRLAMLLHEQGELARVEGLLARSLAIFEQHLGPDHRDVAATLRTLAQVERMRGRFGDAERCLHRLIGIVERSVGREHAELVGPLTDLASVLTSAQRHADAEEPLRRALAIVRRDDDAHPAAADVLDALAKLDASRGLHASAEALEVEALRCRERWVGDRHPELAFRLIGIADLRMAAGRPRDAEAALERSRAILARSLGPRHLHLVGVLHRLSAVCFQRGDLDASIGRMQEALEIGEACFGEDDPGLRSLVEALATLFERAGRQAESEHARARAALLRRRPKSRPLAN